MSVDVAAEEIVETFLSHPNCSKAMKQDKETLFVIVVRQLQEFCWEERKQK